METAKIQLTDIDQKLSDLWDEAEGTNKIRASLFNLILYIQKNSNLPQYQKLVKNVLQLFPCRVIMIIGDDSSNEEYLRTSVTGEAMKSGDQEIYCEIIQIEVAGSLVERVPFIVLPHLLPDLPIYLLWTQDPAMENKILPHFEPIAKRIIFDSESARDLNSYSCALLSLILRFHCQIGDLNWSATHGWRRLFAQVFGTADSFITLTQSRVIRIHYNDTPSEFHQKNKIPASYFQAWIASRLNWKFESIENVEGNIRLVYRRPLGPVVLILIAETIPTLRAGALLSIDVESQHNKGHYCFKRHPESRQVFIQYSNKDQCNLPYCSILSGTLEGEEIIQEIFYPSTRRHFADMLEVLSKIVWSTGSS